MPAFTILGAGTWGTVMAAHLSSAGHRCIIWHHRQALVKSLFTQRRHPNLSDFELSGGVEVTSDLPRAVSACDVLVIAVPAQNVRTVIQQSKPHLGKRPVVNLSKGIETHTVMRMSEVIADAGAVPFRRIASLYGPSHAEEVSRRLPTTLVAASVDLAYARRLQEYFSTPTMRVYASQDIIGVEIGGSMKNVIAIAAGICIGLGFGDNSLAALLTRGLAEITRLGVAAGAKAATFAGLSGIGDLLVTCYSLHSRNRYLGVEIGRGIPLEKVQAGMTMLAEGVQTARSVQELAARLKVDLPICREVSRVLFEDKAPLAAITDLMNRDLRDEDAP